MKSTAVSFRAALVAVAVVLSALMPSIAAEIIATPNPWIPTGSKAANRAPYVTFINLPASGELSLYTTTGELVFHTALDATGTYRWVGRNDSGESVASGLYLWVVKADDGSNTKGKIVVLR